MAGRRSTLIAACTTGAALFAASTVLGGATVRAATTPVPFGDATTLARGDFDGDGFDDLAIGSPLEDVGGKQDAGAVNVLYGSAGGLSSARNQFWHQGKSKVPGQLEKGDQFGWALASGDFNGDGRDDLAIGVPYESVIQPGKDPITGANASTTIPYGGYVVVLYGSASGLSGSGSQGWSQASNGVHGRLEVRDHFGWALAAADFNGDGRDDLAIGVPGEDNGAGAVNVLYGRGGGLSANGDALWQQGQKNVHDTREREDWFGASLAAADFGYSSNAADLAIGAPGEEGPQLHGKDAGVVHVLYGQSSAGLTATSVTAAFLNEIGSGLVTSNDSDRFGWALAAGDFGRSDRADLAVGAPGESRGIAATGVVHVFYGGSYGVSPTVNPAAFEGYEMWSEQGPPGGGPLHGSYPENGEQLGRSLAAADFGGSGHADLAIGVPFGKVAIAQRAGVVHVVYGSSVGLRSTEAQQDQLFISFLGNYKEGDLFGFALAGGAFGKGGHADLAIAQPGTDHDFDDGVGAVGVLYSNAGGLVMSLENRQRWDQDSEGIDDAVEAGDWFGGAKPAYP